MIVLAIIAILLAIAMPVYSNYSIRAKIGEGLSVAAGAKTATANACLENPNMIDLNNSKVGYPDAPLLETEYIDEIRIVGTCLEPVVRIISQNTGTSGYEPIIEITGDMATNAGQTNWTCSSPNTPTYLLPANCRT